MRSGFAVFILSLWICFADARLHGTKARSKQQSLQNVAGKRCCFQEGFGYKCFDKCRDGHEDVFADNDGCNAACKSACATCPPVFKEKPPKKKECAGPVVGVLWMKAPEAEVGCIRCQP